MKMDYDYGLSRIYELVINSDPCYAFLLDSNSLLQNKLVSAHVLAHADFFRNNALFARTRRDIVESMAASADRFRKYESEQGKQTVEEFLDAALALQEHVDFSIRADSRRRVERDRRREPGGGPDPAQPAARGADRPRVVEDRYSDLFELDNGLGSGPKGARDAGDSRKEGGGTSAVPGGLTDGVSSGVSSKEGISLKEGISSDAEKDLLWFMIHRSRSLEDWQRDILTVIREEMLYFWPQIETKIMNEGWATYWHLRIMRELGLTDGESIEFARTHSEVVVPSRASVNPYLLGLKVWESIERRYDGRAKMFEVRASESDSSFIRNYLTQDLVEELDLYLYQKIGSEWRVVERDWEKVRDKIWMSRVNGGYPVLYVKDDDHQGNGELYLWHAYEGVELEARYTEKTLPSVHRLWGRTVHLETILEGRRVVFSCDGRKVQRRFL